MKFVNQSLMLFGFTMLAIGFTSPVKADVLGRVVVGGVTNQALTEVTEKDCPNASGVGETACGAADVVVDVHRDISNTVNQQVQRSCQDATGAGEDVCQGIDDVNSFKKQLSEQVEHIHFFGGHPNNPQNGTQPAASGDASSTQNTSSPDTNSPQNTSSPQNTPSSNQAVPSGSGPN